MGRPAQYLGPERWSRRLPGFELRQAARLGKAKGLHHHQSLAVLAP
jgi:hypothetical protein